MQNRNLFEYKWTANDCSLNNLKLINSQGSYLDAHNARGSGHVI